MSKYQVETGIPVPPPRETPRARRVPQTAWTQILENLRPGESVLTREYTEFRSADGFRQRRPNRQYAIRKVPGQGWRVWRIE